MAFKDKTGERYNRLLIIGLHSTNPIKWAVKCDCGKEMVVFASNLGRSTKSCGCLKRENMASIQHRHGCYGTPEYVSWNGLKGRCCNPNNPKFHDYGGRGIKICERWLASFENFLADMGHKPSQKHSIERVDVNGNYEPSNCVWATQKVQSNNQRSNVRLEYNGENLTAAQWSEKTGFSYSAIMRRINSGWSASEIVETPIRFRKTL